MATIIRTPDLKTGYYLGTANDDYIYTPLGSKIIGTIGNDYIDGGATLSSKGNAHSTIDYSQIPGTKITLIVNLAVGTATFSSNGVSYSQSLVNIDNLIGMNGISDINLVTGNANNNVFVAGSGSDTFVGGGGFDTVDFHNESSGVNINLSTGKAIFGSSIVKLTGISEVMGSTSASNTMTGSANNEAFMTGGKGDAVNGGGGINTCIYNHPSNNYEVSLSTSNQLIVGPKDNPLNVDILTNIQRLQFSDKYLACDLNSSAGAFTGNTGIVAKILEALWGDSSLDNQTYVGLGLNYLETGTTYSQLIDIALKFQNLTTNESVITAIWTNIIGTTPSSDQIKPFLDTISSGTSINTFVMEVADSVFDTSKITNHIHLTGQYGLAYIPQGTSTTYQTDFI